MRSFTFRWAHPAEAVYVTGTFDNWGRSERLNRRGDIFEKTVVLPDNQDKILYKFVADGKWQHDPTANIETDHEGNVNNVLHPEDVYQHGAPASNTLSSVAPGASTVAMAAQQPVTVEKDRSVEAPGAFPETPNETVSVNPIPASAGLGNPIQLAPGEKVPDPSTFNSNTVQSTVTQDSTLTDGAANGEQTFAVAPIPATGGAGNPIHLQPGEKVPDPSTITGNTVESTVRSGPEAYAQADAQAPTTAPTSDSSHGHAGAVAAGTAGIVGVGALGAAAASGLGNKSKNVIPESSLGMGKDAPAPLTDSISSVGPQSTTAQLAGQVPLEPRSKANVTSAAPTTTAAALADPASKQPTLSESTISSVAPGSTTAALAGQVPKEAKAAPNPTISSVAPGSTTADLAGQVPKEPRVDTATAPATAPASDVPKEVAESQQKAHVSPEASANPEAVREKAALEEELHKKVPESPATSDHSQTGKQTHTGIIGGVAAGTTAAVIGATAVAANKVHDTTGKDPKSVLPESVQKKIEEQNTAANTGGGSASAATAGGSKATHHADVPSVVSASQQAAHVAPEASANQEAVREKDAVENELKQKVPETQAAGQPAPTAAAATSSTAPAPVVAANGVSATGAPQLGNPVADVSPITMDEKPTGAQQLDVPGSTSGQAGLATVGKATNSASRDVSPMSRPVGSSNQAQPADSTAQSQPIGTPRTPGKSENADPSKRSSFMDRLKNIPDSQRTAETGSPATDKKAKRRSFFGRIKDKLSK